MTSFAPSGYNQAQSDVEDQTPYDDYWTGPPEPVKFFFPDGKQYIEYLPMTHGMRSKYQTATNADIKLERKTGDVQMKTDLARDSKHLVDVSAVDWFILRKGEPVKFTKGAPGSNLWQWMDQASPALVDSLLAHIRKSNPWLVADKTLEDIDHEIEELMELRAEVEARGEGK